MAFIIDDLYMVTKKNKEVTIISKSLNRDIITGETLLKEDYDDPVNMFNLVWDTEMTLEAIKDLYPVLKTYYFAHIAKDSYKKTPFKI